MRLFRLLVLVFVMGITSSVHASLVSMDDSRFGVGAIIWDTSTNLKWLKVSKTYGKTASGQFGIGGDFEGFRYATWSEVMQVFGIHSQPSSGGGEAVFQDPVYVRNVMDLIGPSIEMFGGAVDSPSLVGYNISAYATAAPTYDHATTIVVKVLNSYNHVYDTTAYATWGSWTSFSPSGSWLVKDDFALRVQLKGSGNGSVTGNIQGFDCTSPPIENFCQILLPNTEVILVAVPDKDSIFAGWNGACYGTEACTLSMVETKDVTATFNYVLPVRLLKDIPISYSSIQNAYNFALDNDIVQARDAELVEKLLFYSAKTITLHGGYDKMYATQSGMTVVGGSLTIGKGCVVVDRMSIK